MIHTVSIDGDEPITLPEAKQQCYIPTTDDDTDTADKLNRAIKSARKSAENWTWRQIVPATLEWTLDEFPDGMIEFAEKLPLISIESIAYENSEGTQTLNESEYRVSLRTGRIQPVTSWPTTADQIDAVKITFKAGFLTGVDGNIADDEFEDLRNAMLMLVKMYFDNPDAAIISERTSMEAVEIPFGVRQTLDFYSIRTFA